GANGAQCCGDRDRSLHDGRRSACSTGSDVTSEHRSVAGMWQLTPSRPGNIHRTFPSCMAGTVSLHAHVLDKRESMNRIAPFHVPRRAALATLIGARCSANAYSGTITGRVQDSAGVRVLQGAQVRIAELGRTATAGADG